MRDAKLKEVVNKIWPKTKKELEKVRDNAKKLIDKGESYIKSFSEKSADKTKKISLSLKKEQLCYKLGKQLVQLPKSKWSSSKKVNDLVKEIKAIDKITKRIK